MICITRNREHRIGYDLTICAPMSFSLLFAACDSSERQSLLDAHRQSVIASLASLPVVPFKMEEHLEARNGDSMVHSHINVTAKGIDLYLKRLEADRIYKLHLNELLNAMGYPVDGGVKS